MAGMEQRRRVVVVAVQGAQSLDILGPVEVLEAASHNRFRSCLWPTANAHLWMRMRSDLAQLYRKVGREAEAETIEEQLRLLLQTADRPPVPRAEIVKGPVPTPRAAPDR